MFRHILISTDGSPVSSKAAKAGIALANALGWRNASGEGALPGRFHLIQSKEHQ